MAYYTYILRCEDGSLYTGITTDLERRFSEHAGRGGRGAKYTAGHRPVRFEAAWVSPGRGEALRLERRIKGLTRPEKERLIEEDPEWFALSPGVRVQVAGEGKIDPAG